MNQSLSRLRRRLTHYEGQLTTFETHYRAQIETLLREELPRLETLHAALEAEQSATQALAAELRVGAVARLEAFESRAIFGEVDIAFWRKQEVTRQLREAAQAQAQRLRETRIPVVGTTVVAPLGAAAPPEKPKREEEAEAEEAPDAPDEPPSADRQVALRR